MVPYKYFTCLKDKAKREERIYSVPGKIHLLVVLPFGINFNFYIFPFWGMLMAQQRKDIPTESFPINYQYRYTTRRLLLLCVHLQHFHNVRFDLKTNILNYMCGSNPLNVIHRKNPIHYS